MTNFNVLAVRSGESDDSLLYPIPGDSPDTVELTEADREPLAPLTATELSISELQPGGKVKRIVHVEKMKASVLVTDARVTVACSKYEKGGGWTPWSIGAIPVAIAANTASKLKASRRRRGKMLVGHVRHPQLVSVGFRRLGGLKQREQLRLGTFDPTAQSYRGLMLDITLGGNSQPAASLAQQIASRAAQHRLESDEELDVPTRKLLEELRQPEPLQPQAKQFSSYFLVDPSSFGKGAA